MSADFSTYISETPSGDTYGLGVGTLVLFNGTQVAVSQKDDETALAFTREVWSQYLNSGGGDE